MMTEENKHTIFTTIGELWREESGIVFLYIRPGTVQTLARAKENFEAALELSQPGEKLAMLIDASHMARMETSARDFFVSQEVSQKTSACAILIASSLGRLMGNFFLRVHRPAYPFKLFTDKDTARQWLLETSSNANT